MKLAVCVFALIISVLIFYPSPTSAQRTPDNLAPVRTLCWNADGSRLIVGRSSGILSILDSSGLLVDNIEIVTRDRLVVDLLACHPNNPNKVIAGILDLSSTVQQMTLYLVDLSTSSTHVISTDLVRIRSVDWKPATDIVAISGVSVIVIEEYDRTQVWNTTTDTEIITFEEFSFGAVWSIDGQQLVTVDNQAITIRDTNWMPTSIIPIKQIVGGATIDLSPNDDLLVITEFENYTHNNIISVWNIATNQLISTRGSENIIDIMWSPDGTAFAILESDTIHIIDPLTGSTAATYLDDIDEVTAIAWDKANCRIAYAHVLKPEIVGQIDFINLSDYTDPNPSPQTGE